MEKLQSHDVHFDLCGDVLHQADLRLEGTQGFDCRHLDLLFVDVKAFLFQSRRHQRGSDASENLSVFAYFDAYLDALSL